MLKNLFKPLGAWGLLPIRLFVGGAFVLHGYGKVFGPGGVEGFSGHLTQMGIEPALPLAWAAALAELVGGALLAIGFFTRFAAAAIMITMAVAVFKVHWNAGFLGSKEAAGFELPLGYLICALGFFISGPGPCGVDNWIAVKPAEPPKK